MHRRRSLNRPRFLSALVMTRLNLRWLICGVLALRFLAACASAEPAKRPNVLFILIDDMGYGDLGCYDKQAAPTPRIDELAKEGIRFTQFYVSMPICSPSRCSL